MISLDIQYLSVVRVCYGPLFYVISIITNIVSIDISDKYSIWWQ